MACFGQYLWPVQKVGHEQLNISWTWPRPRYNREDGWRQAVSVYAYAASPYYLWRWSKGGLKSLAGYHGIMRYFRLELIRRAALKRGIAGLVGTALKMIRSRLLGRWKLVYGLAPPVAKSVTVSGFEIVCVSSRDMIDESLRDSFRGHEREISWGAEGMLSDGACLWVGYLDGKLASVIWTRTGDKVKSYFFPMTASCVLISHVVTISEYRGHGLLPAMLIEIIHKFMDNGCSRFYIDCWDWNESSQRMIERVGFSLIGRGKHIGKDKAAWYQESPPDLTQMHKGGKGVQ